MKFKKLLLCFFCSMSLSLYAQDDESSEKIQAAKTEFITNRINLTPQQSPHFWEVYHQLEKDKKEMNQQMKALNKEIRTSNSEDKIVQNIKEIWRLKHKKIDLEADYMPKFLKVISVRQLSELYKAEYAFTQILYEKLKR